MWSGCIEEWGHATHEWAANVRPYCTGDDEKGVHQVSQFFSYRRCDVQKTKDRLVKVIASRGGSANFEPDSKQ